MLTILGVIGIAVTLTPSVTVRAQQSQAAQQQIPAPSSGGDEGYYVPITVGNMGIELHNPANTNLSISFFASVRQASGNAQFQSSFAFTPYFEFLTFPVDNSGTSRPYIILSNPDGTKNVKMRLAFYDDKLKDAAAAWLSENVGAFVSSKAVQPLPIRWLQITEKNSKPAIPSVTLPDNTATPDTDIALPPSQDIFFRNLTDVQATQFVKAIDLGNVDFNFTYSYKKGQTTVGSYVVRLDDVSKTAVFQQLTGGGAPGFVSRNGAAQLAASVVSQLDITSYLEDDSTKTALVSDIIDLFLNKMQFKQRLDYADKNQLKLLSSLSIDPRGVDFEADRISKTHDAVATSHDFHEINKKLLDLGASGGYGGFTASANFKSNDEADKAIKDTFSEDWIGNDWASIPKTINVFQINATDFKGSASIRQVSVKPTFSMKQTSISVQQGFPTSDAIDTALGSQNRDTFVLIPVGSVIAYTAPVDSAHSLPSNFMICDGTALKKIEFPTLWNALQLTYGNGSQQRGASVVGYDFNLPDLRGYFLRGIDDTPKLDTTAKRDPDSPRQVGSIQPDDLKRHSHTVELPSTNYQTGGSTNGLRYDNTLTCRSFLRCRRVPTQ